MTTEPLKLPNARLLALFQSGIDTHEIGMMLDVDECVVYNLLARRTGPTIPGGLTAPDKLRLRKFGAKKAEAFRRLVEGSRCG